MEKVIIKILSWYLEKNNLINMYQSGFRQNRSTKDHLFTLQDDIRKSLNNKQKTVVILLDIEKAHDMLWKEGLLFRLFQLGITDKLFNGIQNFLQNRKIQIKINESFSQISNIDNGTPQGSSLSPILFLIMINDLKLSNFDVKISILADDIAIWYSGRNVENCVKTLQKSLDEILKWCKKMGF